MVHWEMNVLVNGCECEGLKISTTTSRFTGGVVDAKREGGV